MITVPVFELPEGRYKLSSVAEGDSRFMIVDKANVRGQCHFYIWKHEYVYNSSGECFLYRFCGIENFCDDLPYIEHQFNTWKWTMYHENENKL